MSSRVITISREFGSGGRTVGKKVTQALGLPCYDRELLQKIAQESGFNENYVKDAGEYAPGGFLATAFSHRGFAPPTRTTFGRFSTGSSPSWQSKGPALSWAAAPTISCAARPTACGCLSTQTWTSGRGASWRYMASGRPRLSNASGTRINAGQPTTGFIPT